MIVAGVTTTVSYLSSTHFSFVDFVFSSNTAVKRRADTAFAVRRPPQRRRFLVERGSTMLYPTLAAVAGVASLHDTTLRADFTLWHPE